MPATAMRNNQSGVFMALRRIITKEDPSLYKKSHPVTQFNDRIHTLMDDLRDTLLNSDGVGLAAPQVGVLRKACVVLETNVPEGEEEYIIELINPEIISSDGEQTDNEGCLSFPGEYGEVSRPMHVVVKAFDRYGKEFTVEGEGLTARCYCHEIDHLNGVVFPQLATKMFTVDDMDDEEEDED